MIAERLAFAPPAPAGLLHSWRILQESPNHVDLARLPEEFGCSRRHLIAQFHTYFGVAPKAAGLFGDIFQSLQSGGVFLLMEPAGAEPPFASGFNTWRKEQPSQHSQHRYEDWRRFWSRVDALLGYDYGFLGEPNDQNRIGDGLSVMQWVGLLTGAGFESIDILLRDAEKVVLATVKP